MAKVSYQERGDAALLTTEEDGEWIKSDSVASLSEWV